MIETKELCQIRFQTGQEATSAGSTMVEVGVIFHLALSAGPDQFGVLQQNVVLEVQIEAAEVEIAGAHEDHLAIDGQDLGMHQAAVEFGDLPPASLSNG